MTLQNTTFLVHKLITSPLPSCLESKGQISPPPLISLYVVGVAVVWMWFVSQRFLCWKIDFHFRVCSGETSMKLGLVEDN